MIEAHSQLLNANSDRAHERSDPPRALHQCEADSVIPAPGVKRAHTKLRFFNTAGFTRGCRPAHPWRRRGIGRRGCLEWNFGTLSPCSVSFAKLPGNAIVWPLSFLDSIIDLGLEGQYGPLSDGRCLAVLMKNLRTPILSTAQTTSTNAAGSASGSGPSAANSANRATALIAVRATAVRRARTRRGNKIQCRQAAIGSRRGRPNAHPALALLTNVEKPAWRGVAQAGGQTLGTWELEILRPQ